MAAILEAVRCQTRVHCACTAATSRGATPSGAVASSTMAFCCCGDAPCSRTKLLALALPDAVLTQHTKPCGPNPGGQMVKRADGSQYPYFGMPCTSADENGTDPACGDCFLDQTCVCTPQKCCAPRPGPPGYTCLPNGTDLLGQICLDKDVGLHKSLTQLASLCDAARHAGAGGTSEGCQCLLGNSFGFVGCG